MALVTLGLLSVLIVTNLSLITFFQCYSYKLIIIKYARKFNCYCHWCEKLQFPKCCGGKKKARSKDKEETDADKKEHNTEKVEVKTKNTNSKNKNDKSQQFEKMDEDLEEEKVSEKYDDKYTIKNSQSDSSTSNRN